MSKAIAGAATLGAAAILGAFTLGVGGAALEALMNTTTGINLLIGLVTSGLSMEAGAIAGALTSNRGQNITVRQAAGFRQIIYGEQRIGGTMIYRSTTGSHHDQINYVLVIADHVCDSIVNLYLDGRQVFWQTGSGGNTTRNGVNFGGNAASGSHTGPSGELYDFGTLVYAEARYGDQLPGDVILGLTANDPVWAASAAGSPYVGGCTYIYFKREYDEAMFPQEPEIRITVRGKNDIYDPRTGTSGYSTNWALIVANVLTDTKHGLGLDMSMWVNQNQLIAAANVCDEQVAISVGGTESRYACHYHYDTSMAPGDVLETMMPGAGGRLSFISGEYYIWPAYWHGPSFIFSHQNVTSETIPWQSQKSFRDRFNTVNGTYIAPNYPYNTAGNLYDANGFYEGMLQNNFNFAFQPTNYPSYACDQLHGYATNQYLNEDGGIYLPKEMGLQTVLSVSQAQRLAKIALLRNRQQGSGTWDMGLETFGMQEMDVMQFTFPVAGWSNKLFEIQRVSLSLSGAGESGNDGETQAPAVRLSYSVVETDPSVYIWSLAEELTVYDVPAFPSLQSPYTPVAPTNLTLLSNAATATLGIDGIATPRIEAQWNAPEDRLTQQIQLQYASSATPTAWIDALSVPSSTTLAYISGIIAGNAYNVRIRGVRANGAASAWVTVNGFSAGLVVSQNTQGGVGIGSLIASALTDGTATITCNTFTEQVGSASIIVLPTPYTITGLTQAQLWYVYFVDPNYVGGNVTPIATQTQGDYLGKAGYFLIDSIVTPSATSGGSVGRYSPSTYQDEGTRTSQNAAAAYDGNTSTSAVVSSNYAGSGMATYGDLQYSGWSSVTITSARVLKILFTGVSLPATSTASVNVTIGDTTTNYALTNGQTVLSAPIASGTSLSNVVVEILPVASNTSSPGAAVTASVSISELYIA